MNPESRLTPTGRFVCRVLADDPAQHGKELAELWRQTGDAVVWQFACAHETEGMAAIALERALGDCIPSRWTEARQSTRNRIRLYMEAMDRVAAALESKSIRLVALKNSGIARGLFPDLGGCPMGDVDVLVSPRDFRRAHEVMKSLGFQLGDRSPFELADIEEAERHGGAEYTYTLSDGSTLWFELQWRPVAGRWIRPDQEPPADELIARSVPISGTAARLLGPEDNLLQVCLHTAKHSYVRAPGIRLHTDVDRIVRRCVIDWDQFCARVERVGVRTPVYLSLAIPALMLRTPVPEHVLARLDFAPRKHRLMLRWLERVGWFNPKQKKWSKLGYIGFNLLLYDTLGGIVRAVFPESSWMVKRYEIKQRWTLPAWYVVRAFQLLFKRANT